MEGYGGIVIVIPAYNPDGVLTQLVGKLSADGFRLLVVDDGTDTEEGRRILNLLPDSVCLLRHGANMGKGAAVKTGLLYLLDTHDECAAVITADCDGKHRPEDIKKLADRLLADDCEMVIGCRVFDKSVPKAIRLGNAVTRRFFAWRTHVKVSDTQTGLRGFKRPLLEELSLIEGKRYEYELNVMLWAAESGKKIDEVGIFVDYSSRRALAHFHLLRDSVLIYSRLLKFTAISFSAFLIDYFAVLLMSELTRGLPDLIGLFISVVTARIISSGYAYFMNRRLVFKIQPRLPSSLTKYFLMIGTLLAANYLLLIPISELFGMFMLRPLIIAKPLVDGALFFLNYALQNRIIFSKKQKEK